MTTEITFSNLYWCDGLRGFFFRSQSEETFNIVTQLTVHSPVSEDRVARFFDEKFESVDDMDEYLYEETVETILDEMREYGIEIDDEE